MSIAYDGQGFAMSIEEVLRVPRDVIQGRDRELTTIADFISGDRTGPRTLILEGEAGVGKSTLWREGVRLARDRGALLASRPSEAETKLSFTVLGDLLAPVLAESLERLPAGQRAALEAALVLDSGAGSRPDVRAVCLAVLGVLRSVASDGPVTLAIDDVQWTDVSSARALSYALRRLDADPVTVLVARRATPIQNDPLDLAGMASMVETLTVGPVEPAALGRLLHEHLGRRFPPPLVRRIHDASGGNPFFALEIGRALERAEPNPRPGEPLPVPQNLQDLLRHRLSGLSRPARRTLLISASCAAPTSALVEAAGGKPSELEEAEVAEIITLRDGTIEFTHPLLASTVYASASSRARREVHATIGQLATDLEERARHLALSATGPAEDVATTLEAAAVQAESRGAPMAGAELYQLAASLTPPDAVEPLRRRRHGAMGNLHAAGDVLGARVLNERLLADLEEGPGRAYTLYVMANGSWNDVPRVRSLLDRALKEVGDDNGARASIFTELAWAALFSGEPAASAIAWSDQAIAVAEPLDDPQPLRFALSIRAMAGAALGQDTRDLLDRSISLEGTPDYGELGSARITLGLVHLWAGSLAAARTTLEEELDHRIDYGREAATFEVRADLAEVEYRAGNYELAARYAGEAHEILIEATWFDVLGEVLPVEAAIACALGDTDKARALGTEALTLCERLHDRWSEIAARSALGFLELSLGDHAACHAWLAPLVDLTDGLGLREPGAFPFVPDDVEALVGMGELEAATALTQRLEEQGAALNRPLALATAARCRGLAAAAASRPQEASVAFEQALEHHERVDQPFELGRTLLVIGEAQRRGRERAKARATLRAALEIFDRLGASLWSDRVQAELHRIGGRSTEPARLTPTEWRVAELAASGSTNREIASSLFISPKTVEANLSRVYHKVGVSSRRQLQRALPPSRDDQPQT